MHGTFSAFAGVIANWIPDPSPDFGANPTGFIVLTVIGFFIAISGHIIKARVMVAIGIAMIFAATFLLPLAVYISKSSG